LLNEEHLQQDEDQGQRGCSRRSYNANRSPRACAAVARTDWSSSGEPVKVDVVVMRRFVLVVAFSSGGPAGLAKTTLGVMAAMDGGPGGDIFVCGWIKSTDAANAVRPAFQTAIDGHWTPHVGYDEAHVTITRFTQLALRFVVCTFTVAVSQ